MPRWKKDAHEFEVSVSHNGLGTHLCRIPKPVMEILGYPSTVRFEITDREVTLSARGKELDCCADAIAWTAPRDHS